MISNRFNTEWKQNTKWLIHYEDGHTRTRFGGTAKPKATGAIGPIEGVAAAGAISR